MTSETFSLFFLFIIFLETSSASWEDYNIINQLKPKFTNHREKRSVPDSSEKLLPWGYSKFHLPPNNESELTREPTIVTSTVLVMGVRDVDEMHEYISVDLELQISWQDVRLRNFIGKTAGHLKTHDILTLDFLDRIWHPDLYIEHVKSIDSPVIISKPASLWLLQGGTLLLSIRMTITVVCQMDFRLYPADTQNCPVFIRSYAYPSDSLVLDWAPFGEALSLFENTTLSNYDLELGPLTNEYFPSASGIGVEFKGIGFTLILRRDPSYHLIQTYLPSVIFILVSWLSFVLPLDSVSERMGFCMTCLFTLTAMFGAVRQSTPNVSYVKAIDIWMVTCIFFVFLTLIQHAMMSRVHKKKLRKQSTRKGIREKTIESSSTMDIADKETENGIELQERAGTNDSKKEVNWNHQGRRNSFRSVYHNVVKEANKYLTLIIPTLFLIFNLIYWITLFVLASKVDHVANEFKE